MKAADFLKTLGGEDPLETSQLNQLVANCNLQTTRDASIYAFGDCAAYQQATDLARARALPARGAAVAPFVYTDQGSLVSLVSAVRVFVGRQLAGQPDQGQLFGRWATGLADALDAAPIAPAGARRLLEIRADHAG